MVASKRAPACASSVEAVEDLGEVEQVVVARAVPGGQQLVAQRVAGSSRGQRVGEGHAGAAGVSSVARWSSRASSCPEAIAQRIVRVPAAPSSRLVTGGTGGSRSSRRASAGSRPMAAAARER